MNITGAKLRINDSEFDHELFGKVRRKCYASEFVSGSTRI